MPVIRVREVGFVRFAVPDLDAMATFLTEFGLVVAERGPERLYMRGVGSTPFLHVTERGEPGFRGVAFEASSETDLETLAATEGVPVVALDGPGGGHGVRLRDPDGFLVEVVAGREPAAEIPTRAPEPSNSVRERRRINLLKRVGQGPAHVRRIGHCVLNVADFRRSEAWYKERFGFITSDEIEAAPTKAIGAFLRCDRGAQPTDHHTLFLIQTPEPGFNHAAFEVLDFDDLMRGNAHLRAAAREHDWGVGRHFLGSQIFDYWRDPWGQVLEHWTDGDLLDAAWGSRRATLRDLLGVQWGPDFPHPLPPPEAPT
jgi:catechol 2,3-dioxygenase-like lactoylglutathione lyase family enzyme